MIQPISEGTYIKARLQCDERIKVRKTLPSPKFIYRKGDEWYLDFVITFKNIHFKGNKESIIDLYNFLLTDIWDDYETWINVYNRRFKLALLE